MKIVTNILFKDIKTIKNIAIFANHYPIQKDVMMNLKITCKSNKATFKVINMEILLASIYSELSNILFSVFYICFKPLKIIIKSKEESPNCTPLRFGDSFLRPHGLITAFCLSTL